MRASRRAPVWPGRAEHGSLLERGERGREHELVLLREQAPAATGRRPHALLARVLADLHARVHPRVGPDVHEAVGGPELDAAGENDRRNLGALADAAFPALGGRGKHARLQRVVAKLVDRSELARPGMIDEREAVDDLRILRADELADLRRPVRVL